MIVPGIGEVIECLVDPREEYKMKRPKVNFIGCVENTLLLHHSEESVKALDCPGEKIPPET